MYGLKGKILFLTLVPVFLILTSISGLAIYNKKAAEEQLLFNRLNSFLTLLESGDLSFDAAQDKIKIESLLSEKVVLSEILRKDYSVAYSSENSAAPLISEEEKGDVDDAFNYGLETTKTVKADEGALFSIVTPLVVNDKVAAVLHQVLLNVESSSRVAEYAMFIIFLMLIGLFFCFLTISVLLDKVILKGLYKLKEATIEIRKGHLSKKIEISSRDEIGELASSFNHMSKDLLDSRRRIEEKVKEISQEHGKISSLVESVNLGVVMVDLSLNVILANSAAKKILGKLSHQKISFSDISKRIKGNIDISQALSYYVKSGKPLNIQEAIISDRYFRLFMSPVRDIAEKVFIGAVMVMEDITEEKNLGKMRSEIISVTSHQLRTPSTIIKGNLEMILGGDAGQMNDMQKELLNDAYLGNQRMIRLINDLMDASKIDEGKFSLIMEKNQLEDVIEDIVKEISPLAKEKKVQVSYKRESMPPVKINRQRVKETLQNLIVNAISYSSIEDRGRVEISIDRQGEDFLRFVVKDNGVGIPEKEQGKLFERFYRGSNVSKMDPGGGSGLGLYIAKAVIEQGGGKISFISKEGEGTIFFATFPICK
jgi:signal transduction histidine kinase